MAMDRSESKQALVAGSTLSLGIIMAVVLFAMANYMSSRHYKRFDWTESKLYSLSEKSENVVKGLDREVEGVIFLSPESPLFAATDELLSGYAAANPAYFKKRTVDAARNRLEAERLIERHGIERANVLVIATADDRRVIGEYDLAEYDYSGAQYGQAPTLKEFKGEQLITSAILELAEAKKPRILFTTGHGEGALDAADDPRSLSQAKDLLGKDNFELEPWDPTGRAEVPADADLVVVAGPQTNFFPPDLELFSRYLESGGRMLFLLDPVLRETSDWVDLGLAEWLRGYGVETRDNIVIDPGVQLPFYGPETIYTDIFGTHPIVSDLAQTGTRVLLALARSVGQADDAAERFAVTELLHTTSSAWGETDLDDLENLQADEGEIQGTISLGVAVSFKTRGKEDSEAPAEEASEVEPAEGEPVEVEPVEVEPVELFEPDETDAEGEAPVDESRREARLVVLGDLDFATSQITNAANSVLLLNSFNWLVEREQLISIEGKKPQETHLTMTGSEVMSVYFWVLFMMPGLSILVGVSVYMRRRR
jgi:hypothetical protein